MEQTEIVALVLDLIGKEYFAAAKKFDPMQSGHEGYAIIKEELDELWEEIKKFPHQDQVAVTREAIHTAAMALRFLVDLCQPIIIEIPLGR